MAALLRRERYSPVQPEENPVSNERETHQQHSTLFTPFQLGPTTLGNRIVMAPMTRSRAGEGNAPTEIAATYYEQRASAGLIITEGTQVSEQGIGYPSTP